MSPTGRACGMRHLMCICRHARCSADGAHTPMEHPTMMMFSTLASDSATRSSYTYCPFLTTRTTRPTLLAAG